MAAVAAVVYINLDRRQDRRMRIESELRKVVFPNAEIRRFAAVEEKLAGCVKSHMEVLKMAMQENWENVLILEDDFVWEPEAIASVPARLDRFWHDFHDTFGFVQLVKPFQAVVGPQEHDGDDPNLLRIYSGTNAAGYWVHQRAYRSLIAVWDATWGLLAATGAHWLYMNDVTWDAVRAEFPCYAFANPVMGYQAASWSDLGDCMHPDRK